MIVVTLRWGVRAYIYVVTIVSILGSVLHEARSHYHLRCVIKNHLHMREFSVRGIHVKTFKFKEMGSDKIQARMNISQESKIFCLSTDCRIEVYM